jgi:hypothetical protein
VNARLACGAMVVIAIGVACTAAAQESVTIALPTTVTFSVPDVSSATPADVDPVTVQFSGAVINPGRVLRISVIANTSTLAGPGGSAIPVSAVSWTVSGAAGGSGTSGTLSSSSYARVFQSTQTAVSGSFDLSFTLAPVPGTLHAGNHTVTIRWKLESTLKNAP